MNSYYYNQNDYFNNQEGTRIEAENYIDYNPQAYENTTGPYIENDLMANIGKSVEIHMSFPDSINEKDKVFTGKIIFVSRDHVDLRGTDSLWYLLPLNYLNYVVFKETPNIFRLKI